MSVCPTITVLSFLSVCLLLKTLDPVCLCLSIHLLIWWCRLAFCSIYVRVPITLSIHTIIMSLSHTTCMFSIYLQCYLSVIILACARTCMLNADLFIFHNSVHLSVYLPVHRFVYVYVSMSVVFICVLTCLSTCLFISICMSVFLSLHLSISPFL